MVMQKWVKKLVSIRDFNSYYKYISSYCFLEKISAGIWLGFLVANNVPDKCVELSDEEARRVDVYRRGSNIYPRPLSEIKI